MRLRSLLLTGLLLVASSAMSAELKYNVFQKGEKVGTCTMETTGNETDGFVDENKLELKQDGKKFTVKETSKYGKDGVIKSKTTVLEFEEKEVTLKALLSDDGAKITALDGDKKQEHEVPLASKTSRVDETNFWFRSIKPEAGKSITYQSFSMQEMAWTDVTLTYVGKKTVKVNDKDVELNMVSRTEKGSTEKPGEIYLDDKGDAVLVIEGDMRIERVQD